MWVAIETSGDRASVAVGRPGSVIAEECIEGARRHAGALPGLLDRALVRAGASLQDVEQLIVGDGPGSFTGLRVGAAVAKALAHTRDIRLSAVPSLLAAAWAAGPTAGQRVLALFNALRGEVYAAKYRFGESTVETRLVPSVWLPEVLLSSIPVPDLIAGDLPEALRARLVEWEGGRHPRWVKAVPSAGCFLELAALEGALHHVPEPALWEPAYGRPAEAQAKWEREHGRRLPDSPGQYR
jgi:tRNA threonylcarbamoyladenosine biosynthesis protein TsaB